TVGDLYTFTVTATGDNPPIHWAADGTLPAGLQLDASTGILSGRLAEAGTYPFTVRVTDTAGQSQSSGFTIIVNPTLVMLDDMTPSGIPAGAQAEVLVELHASGGVKPYRWGVAPGSSWPEGLAQIDPDTGRISGRPARPGTTMVRVQVTDTANHIAITELVIKATVPSRWRRPVGSRRVSRVRIARLLVTVSNKRRGLLGRITTWLGFLGIAAPIGGTAWIVVYAFSTPGSHWTYLGVGVLISLAAFVAGCVVGFLLGIPRAVSSGELRQNQSASGAAGSSSLGASTNLAEISDWLTKLVLGAGLVELTRLGAPVGRLIDVVAIGLYSPAASAAAIQTAKVTAGAILFGYVMMGLLDGYIVTTTWYQAKVDSQS
ncbi:MAG: Ig domain-containing protein, partial [Streptosporangiaceae bacterium]